MLRICKFLNQLPTVHLLSVSDSEHLKKLDPSRILAINEKTLILKTINRQGLLNNWPVRDLLANAQIV